MRNFEIHLDKRPVPQLDLNNVETPWGSVLQTMQSDLIPIGGVNPDFQIAAELVETQFRVAAHIVYKLRVEPGYKIPATRRVIENVAPLAELILSYLNACIEIHGLGLAREYGYALEWIDLIVVESKRDSLFGLINTETKTEMVQNLRSQIKDLKRHGDPVNPIDRETSPHLWRLFDCCLGLVRSNRARGLMRRIWFKGVQYDKKQIKAVLPATTAFATYLDKAQIEILTVENTQIKSLTPGRNRNSLVCDCRAILDSKTGF